MEQRKEFISRMAWLISEINASDKGNTLDIMKLIDYHLKQREEDILDNVHTRVFSYMETKGEKKYNYVLSLGKVKFQKIIKDCTF